MSKRLVKTPKVYIRDSGLAHAPLNPTTLDDALGHPIAGHSGEGFVVENLLSSLPSGITAWYYRTAAGAEIDLVLEGSGQGRYAIEIKRSLAPSLSKGFYLGCDDIGATKRFLVYPGAERYAVSGNVEVIPLEAMVSEILSLGI